MHSLQRPQMKVRLPPEVKAAIEHSANKNLRSMNNEIVSRLIESLKKENAPTAANG